MTYLCNIAFAIFNYFNYSMEELGCINFIFFIILLIAFCFIFGLWGSSSLDNNEKSPPIFQYIFKKLSRCLLVLNILLVIFVMVCNIYYYLYKFKIDNFKEGLRIGAIDKNYYQNYERAR